MKTERNYDDIINIEYHGSFKHRHMPLLERAAQFAPFAALTGYEDEVKETARIVECKTELSEERKEEINKSLNLIKNDIQNKPYVGVVYFVADEKKEGGKYITITERVTKLDEYNKNIVMADGLQIAFDDIAQLTLKGNGSC